MQKKEYLIIPNKKELDSYTKYNFNTFILPLEKYSIGFNVYYSLEEVNELSLEHNIYVIMNKFLHRNIEEFRKQPLHRWERLFLYVYKEQREESGFHTAAKSN